MRLGYASVAQPSIWKDRLALFKALQSLWDV